MIRAIFAVFQPKKLLDSKDNIKSLFQFGWLLIIIRWLYYSIIFQYRDYHDKWMPFVPPPFNLDLDKYAYIQKLFSLPFGILLMVLMAIALFLYFRFIHKPMVFQLILNILGVTFFLPFILVQPVDQLVINTIGWKLLPITIIHTTILIWESWTANEVISMIMTMKKSEKLIGIIILFMTWTIIAGILWR